MFVHMVSGLFITAVILCFVLHASHMLLELLTQATVGKVGPACVYLHQGV